MAKIFLASDHAGLELKNLIKKHFPKFEIEDLGTFNEDSVDYPDFADLVAQKLSHHPSYYGLLVCGSGQGMAIRANRYPHIRAALCWNGETAKLARAHNNANVLCLGGRMLEAEAAFEIIKTFLETGFEGGRHERRVGKLSQPPSTC